MDESRHDFDRFVSAEDRARLVWETEPLAELVAWRRECRMDLSMPSASRFYDWMARELRARQPSSETLTAQQIARMSDRVRALVQGQRLGVKEERRLFESVSAGEVGERRASERLVPWVEGSVAAGTGHELSDEPCEQFVVSPRDLGPGWHVALTVRGDSMEPLVRSGDVVLVRVRRWIERGTVVVVRHPDDGYVVKEVGRVRPDEIELRSLNPAHPLLRIPHDRRLVLGTVVRYWRRQRRGVSHGENGG